jgi:hypothetical protein
MIGRRLLLAAGLSLVAVLPLGATVDAASMAPGSMAPMTGAGHPTHIHAGSCADLGDVVAPLSDTSSGFPMDGRDTMMPAMGSGSAIPVEAGFTSAATIAYADLFSSPHSIVVHQDASDAGIKVYILCGDIGGTEMGATDIAIGLGALNDSGYTGIATLHDNGDGTVKVAVYITTGHAMM